jgi:hypothetical protein
MLWRGWLLSMMTRIDNSSLAVETIHAMSAGDSGNALLLLTGRERRLVLKLQRAGLVIDLVLELFLVLTWRKGAVLI